MQKIFISTAFFLVSCSVNKQKKDIGTIFSNDVKKDSLLSVVSLSDSKEFIAKFIYPAGLSYGQSLKLYSADSISTDVLYFGEHPLIIRSWNDSTIIIDVCVFSVHGDSAYRKLYLDNSVANNNQLGKYRINYSKTYNCPED